MIVVDATVLVDALLDDGDTGTAARAALDADLLWAAPPPLLVEVLSVTRRRLLRGEVSPERASEAVTALGEMEVRWTDPSTAVRRIWELRDNVAACDAAYVAAAEQLRCDLVTGDRRLSHATGIRCTVRVIG